MAKSGVCGFPFWQGSPVLDPGLGGEEDVARDKSEGFCAGWALGEPDGHIAPTRPACPPGPHQSLVWFLQGTLPETREAGVWPMVVLGWEHQLLLEALGMCREAAGMPEEGARRARRVPRVGDSIFHVRGAQSSGFEKPCAHL